MKRKGFISLIFIIAINYFCLAQKNSNDILMTIGNYEVSKNEFIRVFEKNNSQTTIDTKTIDEYLELFINFKLKVLKAESLGLDTSQAFIKELAGYRKQLAKPYLIDQQAADSLLKEAYERLKEEIKLGHIFIKTGENPEPADTLDAYKKAMRIRKRIVEGEDFEQVARQTSDDPTARKTGGNLGYITAMGTFYPIENCAYSMVVGQVSMPIFINNGYHIIKVFDRRKSSGQVRVAHIMIVDPADSPKGKSEIAEAKIREIYNNLVAGEPFDTLVVKYSEDKGTARNFGEIPWFGIGRMVPEFEEAAFALQNIGNYSQPIKTSYGWHIIKLLERKELETFEDKKAELKSKIAHDTRSEKSKNSIINRLKAEYNFKELNKIEPYYNVVTESIYNAQWDASTAASLKAPLFSVLDSVYTMVDFTKYLNDKQSVRPVVTEVSVKKYVNDRYEDFVEKTIIRIEESRLELKYPEFKYLMQEYHDGILLFELTDQLVWSKAVSDTAGLKDYYNNNKNNYLWEKRINAAVLDCANAKIADKAIKLINKNKSLDEITKTLTKKDSVAVKYEPAKIYFYNDSKSINTIFDQWKAADFNTNNKVFRFDTKIIVVEEFLEESPKKLHEIRGIVTADYQTYLEKKWVKELRDEFKVEINQPLLNEIKANR